MKVHFTLLSLLLVGCASTSPSLSRKSVEQLNAEADLAHAASLQDWARAQASPTPDNVTAAQQSAAVSAAAATLAATAAAAEDEQSDNDLPQSKP